MVRRGRGGSHKTKQEMTKHLALLASLGSSGLSEHIGDLEWAGARRDAQEDALNKGPREIEHVSRDPTTQELSCQVPRSMDNPMRACTGSV